MKHTCNVFSYSQVFCTKLEKALLVYPVFGKMTLDCKNIR